MITCEKINEFDLQVAKDILSLRRLRDSVKYMNRDSIEYLAHLEEIKIKDRLLNLESRQSRNLQLFNAELYSHGIRQWGYHKSFMVSMPPVHKRREPERGIYVAMWAASGNAGLPSGCGNSNQRQLNHNCNLYFGEAHESKLIEINHENGSYSAYRSVNDAPFTPSSDMLYWMNR